MATTETRFHWNDPLLLDRQLSDDERLVRDTARAYCQEKLAPRALEMFRHEKPDPSIFREMGELDFLGIVIPEQYGGAGMGYVSYGLVAREVERVDSGFRSMMSVQGSLVMVPINAFGTEAQKQKYLTRLLTGEIVGAYCLSEPGSGSDALGAKTRAVKQADGSYVLNGEKMWITNGGFADVFIVFAKVIDDAGEHFTAFIVERAFGGVSSGKEEHKMGLHGSSTTPVLLQDVRVPAENLLGEVGKGHKIAFNILNFGRYKLGAMCGGASRYILGESVRYASERRQFGQPIASFGAIKHKIGEMIVRAYATESLTYRTAGVIDARIAATPHEPADQSAALAAFEEYAIEASIAKVFGSEALNYVLDENIQVHGGNGFVHDYPAERHYRDARVNRIFEGTNEINRLLIPGMLARRAVKGNPPFIAAAKALQDELLSPPAMADEDDSPLAAETRAVDALKKAALMIFGLAMQTYGQKLSDQQEVLTCLADICSDVYAAESGLLRAKASLAAKHNRASLHVDATRVFVNDAVARVETNTKQALAAMTEGDTLRTMLAGARRLFKWTPIDTVTLRRRLADEAAAKKGYPL